jgi:LPXTG-site transpeptidase (sortase) family protein
MTMTFDKLIMRLNPAKLAIAGTILTVIGLLGVVPVLFSSNDAAYAVSTSTSRTTNTSVAAPAAPQAPAAQAAPVAPQVVHGHPVRVVASTVGVDMPVVDGFYDNMTGEWTLYSDKAQFAAMTSEPNDSSGQTFIYGHATDRVFGKLLNMKAGEQVVVYTSNGYKFTYTLRETEVVTPSNTNILSYSGKPRLLLQTCVGAFSENRKFFILDFTRVEKA